MASSYDPRKHLERLAEKQMKSTLHAKFLEECLTNELVPNGLGLKLKVSVGNNPEDLELQASVDRLLERTSLHIVDIVKEGHLRKAKNLGRVIEEERGKLKKDLSDDQMFDMDSSIFKKTEDKKDVRMEKHKKKLADLTQRRTEDNRTEGEATSKREQKKNKKKVNTEKTFPTDSRAKEPKSVITQQSKTTGKRKRKRKSKSKTAGQSSTNKNSNTPGSDKRGNVSSSDDVIIVGESKPSKKQEPTQTSEQNQSKNAFAPGTKMSYSEAMKCEAKAAGQETTKESLQKTLQTVLVTVQELMKNIQQNEAHGDSSGAKTEMHGRRQRKEQSRSQGAKRRS